MASEQPCYTLINSPSDLEQPNEIQMKADLEKGDTRRKTEALKKCIHLILSGEKIPGILMTVIRFVLPLHDHTIKKLLLIFWEIVPKTLPDGKLMQEMILVCDAYRKDLQHPNEYIRGSTLRFLCKLREPELLEPLMPAIVACLEHRHSYVRRNAVLAIFNIFKNFDFLIPDAPELIGSYLEGEQDMSCRRNAFMMLIHADQERALNYLSSCVEQVHQFGDILQLVIVELIYKVCYVNPSERVRFIRCVYNLLNSSSAAVRYEAAGTLVTLSTAPSAIKAAASTYIELVVKESDNNVKLIVLDRLVAFLKHSTHERVLQELIMDVLRILATPDLEVRKKTLDLVLNLVTRRTVEETVLVLKKEVTKTHNTVEHEDVGKYRRLLIRTLHACCIKYPDVSTTVIPLLTDFVSDSDQLAACDVLVFVREALFRFPELRPAVLQRLVEVLPVISIAEVHRDALWILGEFADTPRQILDVVAEVRQSLGNLPIVDDELKSAASPDESAESQDQPVTQPSASTLVTADGTYATQSAFSSEKPSVKKESERPALRRYLLSGDFYTGSVLVAALTKLALRYCHLVEQPAKHHRLRAECMLVASSVLRLGRSPLPEKTISQDDAERCQLAVRVLAEKSPMLDDMYLKACRQALADMVQATSNDHLLTEQKHASKSAVQPDAPIGFHQLTSAAARAAGGGGPDGGAAGVDNMFDISLSQAVGTVKQSAADFSSSKLSKVNQLTGFSDPIYAEAYVTVNQYDIILDVLVVNQTSDTLQDCCIELTTLGDIKLVEKPTPIVLAPKDFANIKANIKVAGTDNAIIFGNIVYNISGVASNLNVVVLNDIHIDIMDYIVPASCSDHDFRRMWADFEWENKVSINTTITDLSEFLSHLLKQLNMRCITPEKGLSGDSGFLAANLYARSIFGEDALANLSVEKPFNKPDAPVTGHVRIRAKSQGMCVSLGDKVNNVQKSGRSQTVSTGA